MPSGHASHKGHSVKPNTNADNQIDTAAEIEIDPNAVLGERGNATRAGEEIANNPEATARPSQKSEDQ